MTSPLIEGKGKELEIAPFLYNMKKIKYGIEVTVDVQVENKILDAWHNMLSRCYSTKLHNKHPTYIGCSVCEEWKILSNFTKWYKLNYVEGFDLDKDILFVGNKIYSPDTCRYVPCYLNTLLTSKDNGRGDLPLGVSLRNRNKKKYMASCSNGHMKHVNRSFETIEEAVFWYTTFKKKVIKEQATRAFLDNHIKSDVYLALIRR